MFITHQRGNSCGVLFVYSLARTTDGQTKSVATDCRLIPPVYRIPPILQGRRQLPRRLGRLPAQELPPPHGITKPGRVVPSQEEAVVSSSSVASVGALQSSRALLAPRHSPCAGVAGSKRERGCGQEKAYLIGLGLVRARLGETRVG